MILCGHVYIESAEESQMILQAGSFKAGASVNC
jgi:hypothetical protein